MYCLFAPKPFPMLSVQAWATTSYFDYRNILIHFSILEVKFPLHYSSCSNFSWFITFFFSPNHIKVTMVESRECSSKILAEIILNLYIFMRNLLYENWLVLLFSFSIHILKHNIWSLKFFFSRHNTSLSKFIPRTLIFFLLFWISSLILVSFLAHYWYRGKLIF